MQLRIRFPAIMTGAALAALVAFTLALATPASAQTISGARPAHTTSATSTVRPNDSPWEWSGKICKTVKAQAGEKITFCAIDNQDDALLDEVAQSLITYTVNTGTIFEVWATQIYSCIWSPIYCTKDSILNNPSKYNVGGRSSFISNSWYGPAPSQEYLQAIVVDPCLELTSGDWACYNGTLKSDLGSI